MIQTDLKGITMRILILDSVFAWSRLRKNEKAKLVNKCI